MINMSLDDRSGRIRHDSSVPVATQVARDIEKDIRAGRIAPDTRLPSEVDLSQQYGVARMTVRRAVAQLRDLVHPVGEHLREPGEDLEHRDAGLVVVEVRPLGGVPRDALTV